MSICNYSVTRHALVAWLRAKDSFTKTVRKMWVQFAKTGNPSLPADVSHTGKAIEWLPYDEENKYVIPFDGQGVFNYT